MAEDALLVVQAIEELNTVMEWETRGLLAKKMSALSKGVDKKASTNSKEASTNPKKACINSKKPSTKARGSQASAIQDCLPRRSQRWFKRALDEQGVMTILLEALRKVHSHFRPD